MDTNFKFQNQPRWTLVVSELYRDVYVGSLDELDEGVDSEEHLSSLVGVFDDLYLSKLHRWT